MSQMINFRQFAVQIRQFVLKVINGDKILLLNNFQLLEPAPKERIIL